MLSFFPIDVLDVIWDVIESVSEEFLTYFFKLAELHRRDKATAIVIQITSKPFYLIFDVQSGVVGWSEGAG